MNKSFFILCVYVIFISMACESSVVFTDSNPPSVPLINEIPNKYHGLYMCQSDSSLIRVQRYNILLESQNTLITSVNTIVESEHCSIVDGGLYLPDLSEVIPFEYINDDSIKAQVYYLDTLYSFEVGEEAKYYKGQLFLNTKDVEGHWDTWVIKASEDGNLEFSSLSIPPNKELVESLTEDYSTRKIRDKRIQYILSPTLIEFDEILSRDFELECEILIPISVESYYPSNNELNYLH